MATNTFSLYWVIENAGKYTASPTAYPTKNDLDAHGTFLDLKRLPAEKNILYYKRLQSVLPLRGGSNHNGLVHALTRELGLQEFIGLKISPVPSNGGWRAPAPFVRITSTNIILYSNYIDDDHYEIDKTIDFFSHGSGYLLEDVIAEIGTSSYFIAELGNGLTGQEKANGLFPGTSSQIIYKEWVPANTFFALEHTDLIPGTLYFSEISVFSKELSPEVATKNENGFTFCWGISTPVTQDGDYFVNYKRGIVTSKKSSSGAGTCRYLYRIFPWHVRWSPIAVYSLRDTNYQSKVFETEVMLDNSVQHGLVSIEGSEIYSQIFDRSPCLWGE